MSMHRNKSKTLGFQPLGYVLFYGLGAFLITVFSLDGASSLGVLATAIFVYAGAAGFGLLTTLFTEPKALLPNGREICDILIPVALMSGGGLLFWYVSLEVSILAVTAAFPLKVIVEREVAALVFRSQGTADDKTISRLKARRGIDAVMALALLVLGLAATTGDDGMTVNSLGLIGLLVIGGVVAELSMVWLQTKNMASNRRTLAPARQVAYVNLGLALTFVATAWAIGSGAEVLEAASQWQAGILLLVGVLGLAIPTILRLGMVRRDVHPAEVSVLALGFPGATYMIKIFAVFTLMVAGMFTETLPEIAVLQSSGALGVVDLITTLLILVFVVERLNSDRRGGQGNDQGPKGGSTKVEPTVLAMPERPRSLHLDRPEDAKRSEWTAYLNAESGFLDNGTSESLATLKKARRQLGLDAYRALPERLLPMSKVSSTMVKALRRYAELRNHMMSTSLDASARMGHLARQLHVAEFDVLRHQLSPTRYRVKKYSADMRLTALLALEVSAHWLSRLAKPLAAKLSLVDGKSGLERWAHRMAWILQQFCSYDAILHTGIETSWGFRFIIPGTGGIGVNFGAWIMFYSGNLHDYLAQAVPMRVNPGFTFATAVFVWTVNRPGIGYGPSLPWGNAYVDPQRYKLLLGFDGVGYVRTGEWRARGPYATISGSMPFIPLVRITWNASIFSPGFVPLVRWSTPLAERLQAQAETLSKKVTEIWR